MKAAILGAGAMGSLFASHIASAGLSVYLIDGWQPQVEAIRKDGIQGVWGEEPVQVRVPIVYPAEAKEPVDLLIVFVKSMQLEASLAAVSTILHEGTTVLCLMNGAGHERVLRKHVPEENLVLGVTMWTSGLDGPGHFHSGAKGSIDLQEFKPTEEGRRRAMEVCDFLNRAGLSAEYSENVRQAIWRKLCVNSTMNSLSALLEQPVGALLTNTALEPVIDDILQECVEASKLQHAEIDFQETKEFLVKSGLSPSIAHHFPSMYQDLVEHHRPTEVDSICGAVVHVLGEAGRRAPTCELLVRLIHAKEGFLLNK